MDNETLIQVRDLRIAFHTPAQVIHAVNGVDLDVRAGETIAIVGESGSGKSVTGLSLLGAVRSPGKVEAGTVKYRGRDMFAMSDQDRNALRGDRISMVFQDPMNSLDPVMKVGAQLEETIRTKSGSELTSSEQVRDRALELLRLVGIPDPERRFDDYPLAFSGGMRQRIMIALAMCNEPEVLVADEPTTALDVTIQAQVLDVFANLNREFGTAVVLITHNFGIVAKLCSRVAVMYGGRIVEECGVPDVFTYARHPYTRALINSVPRMDTDRQVELPVIEGAPPDPAALPAGCAFHPRCPRAVERSACEVPVLEELGRTRVACWNPVPEGEELLTEPAARTQAAETDRLALSGRELAKHHRIGRRFLGLGPSAGVVRAVDGVDIDVRAGETFGVVGESGCGKSSLARLLVRADDPSTGSVSFDGTDVTTLSGKGLAEFRRTVQMIFQDPLASLNPRLTVGALLEEPLIIHRLEADKRARRKRCTELLEAVGLDGTMLDRYPREFSGGQLQRIAIARALAVSPQVLVCDEPVSALDVSLQAQVINLLDRLKAERELTYVFISHDVSLVRYFTDRMGVMYLGNMVEVGRTVDVLDEPLHPYTKSLIDSVPEPTAATAEETGGKAALTGDLPSPVNPPPACRFHTRCPIGPMHRKGRERCMTEAPPLRELDARPGRVTACHFAEELLHEAPSSPDLSGTQPADPPKQDDPSDPEVGAAEAT